MSQKWVYILLILKNQRGRNFESCNRERKRTAFRLLYRREENSREQERKLRMDADRTGEDYSKTIKSKNKNKKLIEGICKKIRSRG